MAIFDVCNAGTTDMTGVHSIQGAYFYLAASNLATPSYATPTGSILTKCLCNAVQAYLDLNIWPTNLEVLKQVFMEMTKAQKKNPTTQFSLPEGKYSKKSRFLDVPKLPCSEALNARHQDRFLADVQIIKEMYAPPPWQPETDIYWSQ
jgi:hypothetical protein